MDPASAIIGIVSFGLTVFKEINEIRKDFKGAPEKVQALQDACADVEFLLNTIDPPQSGLVSYPPRAIAHLDRLCDTARHRLEEVNTLMEKVKARSKSNGGTSSGVRISSTRYIMKKGEFEEISQKLKELRETLRGMQGYMNKGYLEFIAVRTDTIYRKIEDSTVYHVPQHTISTSASPQPCISVSVSSHERTGTLQCSHDCTCRCHARSHTPLIPQPLAPYVGQLFVSKQVLHPAFTSWNCCNVKTCRGTYLKPAKVTYTLPQWSLFYGSFQSSSNQRIHFSINAYRTVPYSSPIIQAILSVDVHEVRELFAKQQASIWDVDIDGVSIFWHACSQWQSYPTEDQLEIVRFLVEAGADTLLFADTETTYSAHDTLAIGLFTHLLGEHDPGRSFTATIHTNSAAITVFRSIFNMDALDALQDVLSRYYGHSDEDASRLLTSLEATEYAVARSSLFNAIRYTPLEYALAFSPSSVESLLAEGADVAAKPTLAYAACHGRGELIALLIKNGADVNMKYKERTTLHWACYQGYYDDFCELVRCAEGKIDWDARTPEGQNALDLFDEGVSRGHASDLTSEEVEEFRSAIISHMDHSQLHVVEDEPLHMPGAFSLDDES